MKSSLSLLSLSLLLSSASAILWPHLRVTYGDFEEQPRTVAELSEQGWVSLSTCQDANPTFPGDRFARTRGDNDIVLIFDGNGFIAGIQTVVPVDRTLNDEFYHYSNSSYYHLGDFFGQEVYYSTAYFVDPAIICNGGRTQEQFDTQGTGDTLIFQSGPTPDHQLVIPLTKEAIIAEGFWNEHKCFFNMGDHFLTFHYDVDEPCYDSVPFQVVYDLNGDANGIVFQHIANLDDSRYEVVDGAAVGQFILVDAPSCILDVSVDPGLRSLHVYVGDHSIICPQ